MTSSDPTTIIVTRLGDCRNVDFGDYADLELEDVEFLPTVIPRMVTDVGTIVYVLAKQRGLTEVDETLMADALAFVAEEESGAFTETPEEAIVNPGIISEYASFPFHQTHYDAIILLSRFINFQLIKVLRAAAEEAMQEGSGVITQQHIFKWCHKLPYPFNVYFC